jgi:hypothetical protein
MVRDCTYLLVTALFLFPSEELSFVVHARPPEPDSKQPRAQGQDDMLFRPKDPSSGVVIADF